MEKNRPLSWTAIFAGAVAGVGLNFLLNLLALSIGLASFAVNNQGQIYFSYAGFLGFCLAAMIAMFTSGWVAAKLTPFQENPLLGPLIGFLTWSVLLMLTIIILTNMIQFFSFHSNFTSNLVAIKITNQGPMMVELGKQFQEKMPLSLSIEAQQKIVVLNAFLTFLLFSLGAMASCLGGFLGFKK